MLRRLLSWLHLPRASARQGGVRLGSESLELRALPTSPAFDAATIRFHDSLPIDAPPALEMLRLFEDDVPTWAERVAATPEPGRDR